MYRTYAYDEPVRATPQFNISTGLKYYSTGTSTSFPSTPGISDVYKKALVITEDGLTNARGYHDGIISVSADF